MSKNNNEKFLTRMPPTNIKVEIIAATVDYMGTTNTVRIALQKKKNCEKLRFLNCCDDVQKSQTDNNTNTTTTTNKCQPN